MPSTKIRIHRYISWLLAVFSLLTIATGYSLARGWIVDVFLVSALHRISEFFFIGLLVIHVSITIRYFRIGWRTMIDKFRNGKGKNIHILRLIQRLSSWLIVIFALVVIVSGLNGYEIFAQAINGVIPFALHRVADIFLITVIVVHVAVGLKFMSIRRRIKGPLVNIFIIGLTVSLLFTAAYFEISRYGDDIQQPTPNDPGSGDDPPTNDNKTDPDNYELNTFVTIEDEEYGFDYRQVRTVRPDIFKPFHFSMFDVLVHLNQRGVINVTYYWEESMNTHIVDKINGKSNWWYRVRFSGGWWETNVFRMDHYPWKQGTDLQFYQTREDFLEDVYRTFIEEIERKEANNGLVIIPSVRISYSVEVYWEFTNVPVTSHDLRNDTFQPGVITALDVIMSLGDAGNITYSLQWYDSIGTAEIVRSYWVEMINGLEASGTCGWVYESGSYEFEGFIGNHIHLPSDVRVLNSPEYNLWFWICL